MMEHHWINQIHEFSSGSPSGVLGQGAGGEAEVLALRGRPPRDLAQVTLLARQRLLQTPVRVTGVSRRKLPPL